MNNIRYVIEWQKAVWDEGGNDKWKLYTVGDVNREIFEDECEFNYRITELNKGISDDFEVKICGVYTCELQPIRGVL